MEHQGTMCFDTTASNTGRFSGALILLEAFIGYPLLWTSCRHHMLEVIFGDAFKVIIGPTSSPMVNFLGILKSKWPTLNLSSITRIDDSHQVGMEPVKIHRQTALQALQKLCSDCSTYLPRDDYEELLKLSLFYLDKTCFDKFVFRRPGTQYHARWMSAPFYAFKMYLLQSQLGLYSNTTKRLKRFCDLCPFFTLHTGFNAPWLLKQQLMT